MQLILDVENLVKEFPSKGKNKNGNPRAIDDISFQVFEGEALGLVGESGSGKSTTARCILHLLKPTSGRVSFQGENVLEMDKSELKSFRKDAQIIFQDPYSSLDPRMKVGDIIGEGIQIHNPKISKQALRNEVTEMMDLVGLRPDHFNRFPRAFSGGERQRIGIARALAVKPKFLICDEPVASLDVSIQAQILNLLQKMKEEFGLTILFIAHDLATVRHLCTRIAVMESGKIREIGDRSQIYENPQHPYTQSLIAIVPEPDPISERARLVERKLSKLKERP
jgi:ABC-type oligopeptide transport system ATPase subunit